MKKWLAFEVLAFTLIPAVLLLYSAPLILFTLVQVILPLEFDTRSFALRLLGVAPYAGGGFGIGALWYFAARLHKDISARFWWIFVLGMFGGFLASWEILKTTNLESSLFICVPPWVLAVHLAYLFVMRNKQA